MSDKVVCPECGESNFLTVTKGMLCKNCGHIIETGLFNKDA